MGKMIIDSNNTLADNRRIELEKYIGTSVYELPTPSLIVELDCMEHNLKAMQRIIMENKVALRPSIKTHKSIQMAKKQLEFGASGIGCSTLKEVEAMASEDIKDIWLSNTIVTVDKINKAASLVKQYIDIRFTFSIDNINVVTLFNDAAKEYNICFNMMLDIDTGMGRCGVRKTEDAVKLAKAIEIAGNLKFVGISGYNSKDCFYPTHKEREEKSKETYEIIERFYKEITNAGIEISVVSAGGSGDFDIVSKHPLINEIQAGTYIYFDYKHIEKVQDLPFKQSIKVLSTVISTPEEKIFILDAGWKAITMEFGTPRIEGKESLELIAMGAEHLKGITETDKMPKLGEKMFLLPKHACTTNNLYSHVYGVRNGIVEEIIMIDAK